MFDKKLDIQVFSIKNLFFSTVVILKTYLRISLYRKKEENCENKTLSSFHNIYEVNFILAKN